MGDNMPLFTGIEIRRGNTNSSRMDVRISGDDGKIFADQWWISQGQITIKRESTA